MACIVAAGLMACQNNETNKNEANEDIIGKVTPRISSDIMTPEILYSFGRIGSVEVSPDQSKIVYQVTYVSIDQNRTNSELFLMDIDGSNKKQLTRDNYRQGNPQWIERGEKIAYLTNKSGSSQIWTMNAD